MHLSPIGSGWLAGLPRLVLAGLGLFAGAVPTLAQENIDPAGSGAQYAWTENAGWLNAEPAGNAGPGAEVGDQALTGHVCGESIDWISLSCQNTASCAANGYQVVNDGHWDLRPCDTCVADVSVLCGCCVGGRHANQPGPG